MKKFTLTFMILLCLIAVKSQVPTGFSYQAVVRNSSGEIIAGKTVKFQFSILRDSEFGAVVYKETHSIPTNNFGLATLNVGMGTKVSGTFDPAAWGNNKHYLKVELDPDNGTTFSDLGTTELLAVPYAFHAKTVEDETDGDPSNEIQHLNLSGTVLSLTGSDSTVVLPSSGGGDNWGTDYVLTNETLAGQGTQSAPLKIAQQSATTGQVLKWNGTIWSPANDEGGGGALTLPYSGSDSFASDPVFSITNTGNGSGIKGKSNATSGVYYGVIGESSSVNGSGVYASAPYMGVEAHSSAANGIAIWGYAYDSEGTNYGMRGVTNSSNGYSGFFQGGRFFISGNTGIGIDNPSAKLDIDGQIKIRGGSPGAGKVLTSDENGLASWQTTDAGGFVLPYEATGTSTNPAFKITNTNGSGIYGFASATWGDIAGIYGNLDSSEGAGVWGVATSSTGNAHGVVGETGSAQGKGVIGRAFSNTGITYGVYGTVSSASGFAGYFEGGKFYIGGNTGIGTENPSAKLEVAGQVKISGGSPGEGKVLTSDASGLASWVAPSVSQWVTSGSNIYYNSGNVGIGTNNPTYKLTVNGDISLSAGGDRFIALPSGTRSLFIGGRKQVEAAYAVHLVTNDGVNGGVVRMSVISDKVSIGTTSPTQMFDVNGNARFRGIGSGAYAGVVNLTSDGTLTTATSDERLKENINSLENSLDKIMQLRGVSFTWKTNPEYGRRIGFIAQEFEKVIPELVFTNPTDGYKGINYAEVSAVIVEAVKEQQKIIEELKTENNQLIAENEKLKAKDLQVESRLEKLEQLVGTLAEKIIRLDHIIEEFIQLFLTLNSEQEANFVKSN